MKQYNKTPWHKPEVEDVAKIKKKPGTQRNVWKMLRNNKSIHFIELYSEQQNDQINNNIQSEHLHEENIQDTPRKTIPKPEKQQVRNKYQMKC